MKAAIYSRVFDETQLLPLQLFFEALFQQQIEPIIYQPLYEQIKDKVRLSEQAKTFTQSAELTEDIEHIISLGGDGTLLDTIALIRNKKIAVMGINFGRLGFLASIGKEQVDLAVRSLANRTYVEDHRTLIHLDANIPLFGEVPYALNEFTLLKRDINSMIKIHTYLNGEFLNTYWADGLIVSTPTGSTGYSMSCNGPILFPDAASFVITPVAPHNLNVRPIVLSDSNELSFEIEGRSSKYRLSCDSRTEVVDTSVKTVVKKAPFEINLIRLHQENYLETLRNKLLWGIDTRNY